MNTKKLLLLMALIALLGLHFSVLYAALHPKVSREYREYYIQRTASDWNPIRYPATAEQGIDFGAPGLPTFVESMYGFSFRDPVGRWTDAARATVPRVVFLESFSGPTCLYFNAQPAGSQLGKPITVAFEEEKRNLLLRDAGYSDYFVDFRELANAKTLEFHFAGSVPRESAVHPWNPDIRQLGLSMVKLKLFRGTCSAKRPHLTEQTGQKNAHN